MNNELEGHGRKQLWPNLRYYNDICLERLRKTTNKFSQDSKTLGQDLNLGPCECEAGVLSILPICLLSTLLS
jgi:hypothetical protein